MTNKPIIREVIEIGILLIVFIIVYFSLPPG